MYSNITIMVWIGLMSVMLEICCMDVYDLLFYNAEPKKI